MITWKETTNKLCKTLDKVWGVDPGTFRRTPLSGAFDKKKFPGDVLAPPDFPFCIECKGEEEGWDFRLVLDPGGKSAIDRHTKQVMVDANRSGKIPVLAMTKKYIPMYFGFPVEFWTIYEDFSGTVAPKLVVTTPTVNWTFIRLWDKSTKAFLLPFDKDCLLRAARAYQARHTNA